MADEKNKDEIEVVSDEPEIVIEEAAPEAGAKTTAPEIKPDDAIEALKQQLESEKRARIAAEMRANQALESARQASNAVDDTNLQLITSAIASLEQDLSILEANLASANANQNYDDAAKIQRQMSRKEAELLQLENGKVAAESKPKLAQQQAPSDPVEAFAAQLSPKSGD